MHKGSYSAGAGKGGSQLLADMGALAHTQEHHSALALHNGLGHCLMLRAQHIQKCVDRISFRFHRGLDSTQ